MRTSALTPHWLTGCVTPLGPLRLDVFDLTYRIAVRIEVGDVCTCTRRVLEVAQSMLVDLRFADEVLDALREQAAAAVREVGAM